MKGIQSYLTEKRAYTVCRVRELNEPGVWCAKSSYNLIYCRLRETSDAHGNPLCIIRSVGAVRADRSQFA